MGVPKFFRYISERYPCLSEILKEYQIPEFDNLYLDMNGIIHGCSHPNDSDYDFNITEKEIFENIFHYIEILFCMIRPQKLFFMAVDGVAPRAKINQQRSRRFRSAKEAEMKETKAKAQGIDTSKKKFDSNCITPGTLFMAKLNEQLRYFITHKISTDSLWQNCKIMFSGSEVPGEGEHKIMDYIRYMKAQPDYDPNTRHCLYGLDADLIMLGLCTHELHFSLLREEVKFGKKQKKITTPEETRFCLLHLSLLRDYLGHEFSPIKDKLSFPFDIERIIDDWVLMGFLVGNDFIPHLPNLHIANGALPVLYHAYMEVLPTLDGYINEQGHLNLERFEKFMERLSRLDIEQFAEHYADLKYFESKTGRKINEFSKQSSKKPEELSEDVASPRKIQNKELEALIKSTNYMSMLHSDEDEPLDDESDSDIYTMEFVQHKRDYYMNKLEYENVDEDVLRTQAEGYVMAIQWNLNYYYNGCCSWSWYYPHHYAPYISDIKDFKSLKLEFELGEPFLPFQQLLAVLPAYSKELLPLAFQHLLTEEHSPIISYYPVDFKTDLNGKRQEWEAVVLIPFINEKELLQAMKPHYPKLTAEEQRRDNHGPMCLYSYTSENFGIYSAPEYFPKVVSNHAKVEYIKREDISVPREELIKGLCPGVKTDVYFPGFPTLQYIKHTASLEKAQVKVFEQPSRGENMILKILPDSAPVLSSIASSLLGQSVYVNWPHLTEAHVVGVANTECKISLIDQKQKYSNENINKEAVKGPLAAQCLLQKTSIAETYKNRLGVNIGDTNILLFVRPLVGSKYIFGAHGKLFLEKQWSDMPAAHAYQTVVQDISVYSVNSLLYKSIEDIFTVGSICFMLGHPHYGAQGEVLTPGVIPHLNSIKVSMRVSPEPPVDVLKRVYLDMKVQFMHGSLAAQRLGISSHLLSRITGTIYVIEGNGEQDGAKYNVGLNLKFSKKNEEVPGYTRKENNQWLYSTKAVDLVRNYMAKSPNLFESLAMNVGNDVFKEDELFNEGSNELSEILEWLKDQEIRDIESRPCGAEILDADIVRQLEIDIDKFYQTQDEEDKLVLMQVKPHLLFKPELHLRHTPPDSAAKNCMFDRVCCIRSSFTVPIGYKGTIIGIQKGENVLDTMYDILFDKPFPGGLLMNGCTQNRGYRLSIVDFINISHGERIEGIKSGIPEYSPRRIESWRSQPNKNQSRLTTNTFTFNKENNHCQTVFPATSPNHMRKKIRDKATQENHQEQNWRKRDVENSSQRPCENMPHISQNATTSQNEKPTANTSEFHAMWNALYKWQKANSTPSKALHETIRNSFQNATVESNKLRRPHQLSGNMQVSNPDGQKTEVSRSFESDRLWNELHKIRKPKHVVEKINPRDTKAEQTEKTSGNSPQDPSAFLKKVLKIPDGSAQNNIQNKISVSPPPINESTVQPQKQLDTPPLVQQLFDQARKNEKKKETETPIWYCNQLLNHFQISGLGMPRYSYFIDKQTNMICARILLPDTRVFIGDPCSSHEQAAENAAAKVYKELKLGSAPKPDMKVLMPPPVQWYNNRQNNSWPQNIRPPMLPPPMCPPKMHHNSPQHPMMPYPKWNPNMPLNVGYAQMVPHNNQIQQPQKQLHSDTKPKQVRNESEVRKPEIKNTTSFVPLQAQKKSRNIMAKQTTKDTAQNESVKKNTQIAVKQKAEETTSEQSSVNSCKTDKKNTQQSSTTQDLPNSQKPAKVRRSRVAANFGSVPTANRDEL